MTQVIFKDQIKVLVDLQKNDGRIYELREELKEKPAMVEALKNEFEETKARLYELEEKLKQSQVERKGLEVELQGKEDGITKANAQLSDIKTNKEYTAKIKEIESMKADKSLFEEKILESFDKGDAIVAEIDKEKAKVAEEEKKYLAKKAEVEQETKQTEVTIKDLEAKKKEVLPNADPKLLELYEKLIEYKQGQAIVPVAANSCGGCHMNVTPQTINKIKMYDEHVQCEFCNRILYLEDDL